MPDSLGPDLARRAAQDSARLVPTGPAPTGHVLTVTDQAPFNYDWRQPPPGSIKRYHGDPNGDLHGRKGDVVADIDEPALWQNTDGFTTWVRIGGLPHASSGWYFDGATTETTVPTDDTTSLDWPPLSVGADLLDLTNPVVPVTTLEGTWSFDATISIPTFTGRLQITIIVIDGGFSAFAGDEFDVDAASATYYSTHLTAALNVGASVLVSVRQDSGSDMDISMVGQVTWTEAIVPDIPGGG